MPHAYTALIACRCGPRNRVGFNDRRLHPDIYMDELLVGMRLIHQVLPTVMMKLKIDEKDFRLDRQPVLEARREKSVVPTYTRRLVANPKESSAVS